MQNVFPARELYNSNPCRDMWDSEQLSQAAASCSQGSQNSSSDLFSQSRMSQLKGFSSFDVSSQQPTNSQQMPEDEPVKYYLKYMTKPPLFSSESERQSSKKQKPQTAIYRELIEIQKKKTAERDDRDVLDSFISLLKDYTKEVKTAMDSFKDSIDTTLATKAEQVANAASQSADLIKKLKDDLLESFGCLRKDLKENEELKEILSKQNEKIVERDSEIKMLQVQLEDCRARELKSMEKQEKYTEREDKLMQKLDEISSRQPCIPKVPLPLKETPTARNTNYNQNSECLRDFNERCVPQNPSGIMALQPQFNWKGQEVSSSVGLHHMTPQTNRLHHPSVQNARVDAFSANVQGTNYLRQVDIPALDYQYQPHSTVPASEAGFRSQDEAVVPSMNIQYQANMGLAQNQPNLVHPTAAIAPMRPFPDDDQQLPRQQEGRADELTMSSGAASIRQQTQNVPVPEKPPPQTNRASFLSPRVRGPSLTRGAGPKQSPVAAVHPQIRVKRECEGQNTKVAGHQCAKRVRKEDPFDIFVFDLTSSPEEENCDVRKSKPTSLKPAPKHPVNTHITRSRTSTYIDTNEQKNTANITESDETINQQRKKTATKRHIPKKLSSGDKEVSNLGGKAKCKQTKGRDYTPNRPVKASLENGIPRSKVAQNVFQGSKSPLKRKVVAAKRKLSFDASELFDGLEDDANIQQITESIRKHAQRKRAAKVLYSPKCS